MTANRGSLKSAAVECTAFGVLVAVVHVVAVQLHVHVCEAINCLTFAQDGNDRHLCDHVYVMHVWEDACLGCTL